MSCDVMCRADVLWVLYAVCGCIVYGVCCMCVVLCYNYSKKSEKCKNIDNKLCATGFRHFLPDSKTAPLGKKTVDNYYQIQK